MRVTPILAAILAMASTAPATATTALETDMIERDIDAYQWDLAQIYPDQQAWDAERARIDEGLARLRPLAGQPVQSVSDAAYMLRLASDVRGRAGKMMKVGLLDWELDHSDAERAKRFEQARLQEDRVKRETAFVEGRIAAVGKDRLARWLLETPELAPYAVRINRILALHDHIVAPELDPAIAQIGAAPTVMQQAYDAAMASNLAWPQIMVEGEAKTLDPGTYRTIMLTGAADTRAEAAAAFLTHMVGYRDMIGKLLEHRIASQLGQAKLRGYRRPLDLLHSYDDGLPAGYIEPLFQTMRDRRATLAKGLTVLNRLDGDDPNIDYFDLQRIGSLGMPQVNFPDAMGDGLDALAPLGPDYRAHAVSLLEDGWMHVNRLPNQGGEVGVFWQVGGGHPHAILPYAPVYSRARYIPAMLLLMIGYGDVPAERTPDMREQDFPVFSNAVWNLGPFLYDRHALAQTGDVEHRRFVLGWQLRSLFRTFVANAVLVEFEMRVADRLDAGEAVTGTQLSAIYRSILVDYFGATAVPDHAGEEWMTKSIIFLGSHPASFAASTAIAVMLDERLAAGDAGAIHAVWKGMAESKSHLSSEALQSAGIDLDDGSVWRAALDRIDQLSAELDALNSAVN